MKNKLTPTLVLSCICIVVALILAAVNTVTAPIIEEIQYKKEQKALASVYPDGEDFKPIEDISSLPDDIKGAYSEKNGGYVFKIEVKGYKSGLVIMCGIAPDGKITGADFIKSSETLSAEVGLGQNYVGQTSDNLKPIIVSGSTKTTSAYANAIKKALESYDILTEKEGK